MFAVPITGVSCITRPSRASRSTCGFGRVPCVTLEADLNGQTYPGGDCTV